MNRFPATTRTLAIVPCVLLFSIGCSLPGGPPLPKIADEVNSTLEPKAVILAPGDLIEVKFPYAETWTHEVEVRPDGRAAFLGIDSVAVAGLTPEQLDERLTQAYTGILPKPDLTVNLKRAAARFMTILGEVAEPGSLEIPPDGRLTLVEAFARAGGQLKATAHLGSTVLVRWDAANQRQRAWTIDARPRHWKADRVVFLQPYDLVYVPNTTIDDVNIWVDQYIRRMIPLPLLTLAYY